MDMQSRTFFVGVLVIVAVVLACGCTQQDEGMTEDEITSTPTATVQAEGAPAQPVPTPPGEWSGDKPEEVKFVNPSVYHITPTETTNAPFVKPPDDLHVVNTTDMKNYATISAENSSGVMTTEIYHIPFPYWELNYTVTGYNSEYAGFRMEIKDAEDPNREVGEVVLIRSDFKQSINSTDEDNNTCTGTLLLREGFKDYYFVIHPETIKSFSINIRVPTKYLV